MDTGIRNTQELIEFAVAAGIAVQGAREDGTINTADLAQLIAVFPTVGPAIEGISKIPHELRDLDAEELETIKNQVISGVGRISGEKAVRIAQHALTAGLAVFQLVNVLRSEDASEDTPADEITGADEEG